MFESLAMPLSSVPEASTDPSAAWVRKAQAGNVQAFEHLYRTHAARVHALCWRLAGGDRSQAEEWVQDVFVRVWRKLGQFRFESRFSTWLHRVAVNEVMDVMRARKRWRHEDLDPHQEDPQASRELQSLGDRRDLEHAIARLPPRARAVLVLFELEGLSHEEISACTGMAVGSSKAQLHRARGLLREWLNDS